MDNKKTFTRVWIVIMLVGSIVWAMAAYGFLRIFLDEG